MKKKENVCKFCGGVLFSKANICHNCKSKITRLGNNILDAGTSLFSGIKFNRKKGK